VAGVLALRAAWCLRLPDGNLIALDAAESKPLWHYQTGGSIRSSPISYAVNGRQYIAISVNSTLVTFALSQEPPR
jgi:outer membrane protein assembly factor BamB